MESPLEDPVARRPDATVLARHTVTGLHVLHTMASGGLRERARACLRKRAWIIDVVPVKRGIHERAHLSRTESSLTHRDALSDYLLVSQDQNLLPVYPSNSSGRYAGASTALSGQIFVWRFTLSHYFLASREQHFCSGYFEQF